MINKQRVHRIKNLIYAFMILVLLLPVILMVILSFKILDTNREIIKRLDGINSSASQNSALNSPSSPSSDTTSPDGGYVIEPENQFSTPEQNAKPVAPGSNEVSQVGSSDTKADVDLYLSRNGNGINEDSQNVDDSPPSDSNADSRGTQSIGGGSGSADVNVADINAGVGMQTASGNSGSLENHSKADVDGNSGNDTVTGNQNAYGQDNNPTTGINNNPQTGR